VYVDARLLDLHGAVESLPSVAASVAVSVAGTPGNQGVRLSLSGTGERSADVA
jgi:hypothetical protein